MTLQPRNYISVASVALFLGGLLWIAAFWFPVFKTAEREIAGYWIFVSGWMGFVIFQFAWYANLLVLIAVILMYTAPVKATLFAALGLLVATQAFWFDVLPETTQSVAIIAKGPGFWFWYAGIFLMSVGVFFCLDTDEVTDVIETPETDADIVPLPTAAVAGARLQQLVQAEAVSQPDDNPFIAAESAPVNARAVEEVPPPLPDTSNHSHSDNGTPPAPVATVKAGIESEPDVSEAVPAEIEPVLPEPFVLNKTDEELEATIPAVTSILQAAVFPEIKKPEQ